MLSIGFGTWPKNKETVNVTETKIIKQKKQVE